mmetsp:Transcript_29581/g.62312  ORF Transcript_29581/g.62312 Transcript_29581/m.62312 type:complete len:320 (+) Transcript_29581:1988-2947(+)
MRLYCDQESGAYNIMYYTNDNCTEQNAEIMYNQGAIIGACKPPPYPELGLPDWLRYSVTGCKKDEAPQYFCKDISNLGFGVKMELDVLPLDAAPDILVSEEEPIGRDEFCQSGLDKLQTHMTKDFEKTMGKSFTTSYECACNEQTMDDSSFEVECTFKYNDRGESFVKAEQMKFESNEGEYELTETSWSHSSRGSLDIPQEVFKFEDGELTSCSANGCVSCTICDDKKYVAVDCSTIGGGLEYSYECSEEYSGSSANTFIFGVIAQNDLVADGENSEKLAEKDPETADDMYAGLATTKDGWMCSLYFAIALTLVHLYMA